MSSLSAPSLPPEVEIALLRAEVASLRQELELAREKEGAKAENEGTSNGVNVTSDGGDDAAINSSSSLPPPHRNFWTADHPLGTSQVERYCRQMLLPWFGPEGEEKNWSNSEFEIDRVFFLSIFSTQP